VLLCRHKVLGSSPSTAKGKRKKYLEIRTLHSQWESVCPACARSWVQFPSIAKLKKNGKEDKWHYEWQPSHSGRKWFNLDQIPHSSSEETEAQNGSETCSPECQVSM
jgi:hypothetical protein